MNAVSTKFLRNYKLDTQKYLRVLPSGVFDNQGDKNLLGTFGSF